MTLVAENPPAVETLEDRLIAATLSCVGRWGLAKTTIDDVARQAQCSRATVYRVFPGGKETLVAGRGPLRSGPGGRGRPCSACDDSD